MPPKRGNKKKSSLGKMVKKALDRNLETKIHCYNIGSSGTSVSTAADTQDLAAIAQGINGGQRIGNYIRPVSLKMRYAWAAKDDYNVCRLIVIQAKDDESISAHISTKGVFSCLGHDFTSHFRVLYDKTTTVNSSYASGVGASRVFDASFKKLAKCSWESANVTALQPDGGKIAIIYVSDSAAATHPLLFFDSILEYKDA